MSDLLPIQRVRSWYNAVLAGSVAGYCALLTITIPWHAPWADEAQAWQIARTNSFPTIFRTAIHYEISPGLWHALLWLLVRLHLPYAGLPWVCACIALLGVCLLLFQSPLPFVFRVLLPFTYFFSFQYSVVARSYVLFAPLLFLLATIWPKRNQRPLSVAVLLGLLANVCAHGFVVALGLFVVLLVEQYRHHRRSAHEANPAPHPSAQTRILSALLLSASLAFALWCMIPPRDANWANGAAIAFHRPALAALLWLSVAHNPFRSVPLAIGIPLQILRGLAHVMSEGVSSFKTLACIAWALLFWRWWREKRLYYTAPVLLLAGLGVFSRFEIYHAGLVWILFLFLWWVTWPVNRHDPLQIQITLMALVFLFIVSQLVWTARVVRIDRTQAYSPDRAAAPILRHYLAEGMKVDIAVPRQPHHDAGEYYAVGLEPYFEHEPFHNAPARYWVWKPHPGMYDRYLRDTQERSVAVMMETLKGKFLEPEDQQRLISLGYRQDAAVCGRVTYPIRHADDLCHVFYVPTQPDK
ncbi:MAG: hypothetical protein WB439_00585 [Acidobacteriaceae bacterium]